MKKALAPAGKQKIGSRSENSAHGDVIHFELPLLSARQRIDGLNYAVAIRLSAARDLRRDGAWAGRLRTAASEHLAFLKIAISLAECGMDAFPGRNIEKAGARTPGR